MKPIHTLAVITGRTIPFSLQWRYNGRDGVSNHQPHDCLLNRLFRRRSKKTSKLRVTGLCAGNSTVTGEFPAQMASNGENVSIWWRHHVDEITSSFLRVGVGRYHHASVVPTRPGLFSVRDFCCDVTWVSWPLRSPAAGLFSQQLVQANNKDSMKVPHYRIYSRFVVNNRGTLTKNQ